MMNAPKKSLIAYAAQPGKTAADAAVEPGQVYGRSMSRNGVYTRYLLHYLNEPAMTIERAMKHVRAGVQKDTGGRQEPWEATGLFHELFFAGH
jgi:uncharacterized caspase-like protein